MMQIGVLGMMVFLVASCGYNLRGNTRVFFEKNHIERLYVSPVKNNSYKAGIEIVVYNALRKRIAQGGYVRFVDSKDLADAILDTTVLEASHTPAATTSASSFIPLNQGSTVVQVASSYTANLKVGFGLKTNKGKGLWGDQLMRSKTYQASTFLGSLGSTAPLINESEFEDTLADLAVSVVTDAEESMNTLF